MNYQINIDRFDFCYSSFKSFFTHPVLVDFFDFGRRLYVYYKIINFVDGTSESVKKKKRTSKKDLLKYEHTI